MMELYAKTFFLALLILVLPVHAWGEGMVQVIRSDDREMIVELTLPGFQVQQIEQEGKVYQKVTIHDSGLTTEVGHPQLPVRGEVIGIPAGTHPTVQILAADFKTLPGYDIAPVPQPVVEEEGSVGVSLSFTFVRDASVYTADAFYPPQPVAQGFTGKMRDQEVMQLLFYPLQINPARRELRFYNRILVRIGFDSGVAAGGPQAPKLGVPQFQAPVIETPTKNPYESLLKGLLLNYPELRGR